jgi:type IV pilus assembly protein PilY1
MDDVLPGTLPVGGTAVAITGLTPGAAWPPPFREDTSGSNAVGNSASDYVTNYWVTNLRPAMPENVATSARDPASWPHQNFAAMSLGTEGILPSGNQSNVEAQLTAGTLQWPKPQPTVYKPDQSGVDDLWHAAINGRGRFVNAQSADELKLGMGQILQDVVNQAGARTGASFQSTSISATANFIYRTSFQPGWGSSLRKVQIDPVTGAEIAVAWDASAQLASQLTVVPGVKDTPWFTDRIVVTIDETGKAVPFLDASIGSNQLDSLAPGKTARASAILAFLRGDRSREGTKVGQFRVRIGGLLGDIVDSQPVYVGAPGAPYLEANDPGYTLNFKDAAAFKTRPARIYVGANDGMLHAFDDATGNEAWAFVPADLYRPDQTGLGALSYQDGALPPFQHHFYVDATPRITDVNFGGGDSDWHTILVGGLGKGGKSYYALDISQPNDITSEAEAAKRVLWEFTDADMGYSYGRAIVAKTHAFSGQWLVIVTSGYNNASGLGKVFFLRASDGKLLKTLSTGAGTATTPSGLTHIAAYEKDFRNQVVEQIYGGDLLGNFWRFDVSDSDDSNWGAAEKIATLTDPVGTPQPVTIPPQIEIDIANGIDRWVFIGTGRLLDDLDLTTPAIANQIQTMYAFRDGTAAAPIAPWPAVLAPRTDMAAVTDAAGLAAKPDKGWYDDLPLGQRIVVPVQAALSVIAYVGTSPQTDPCLTGQPATLYAREYGRGNSLLTDDTGATIEGFFQAEGIVGIELVVLSGGSTDSGAGGFPDLRIAITAGTPGKATGFPKPKAPDFAQKHRMSWRLLGQ